METYMIFICFIVIVILIIKVVRVSLFNYITNIDKIGKHIDILDSYNSYFHESKNKKDRQMINNIAFIRGGFLSNIYDSDIKILELKKLVDGNTILSFNNNDCNFEIYLIQKIVDIGKNIKIVICKTNIIEAENCSNLVKKLGYGDKIEVIYLNDISNINTILNKKYPELFQRIILRENIGRYQDRTSVFSNIKTLLSDNLSFIYIKTLTFEPFLQDKNNNKNFLFSKQASIIDFWNYNFSTNQNIINDLKELNYEVKYKTLNVTFLSIFYNPEDVINLLKLYFIDLNLNVCDILNWLGIYSLNLLNIKAYNTG